MFPSKSAVKMVDLSSERAKAVIGLKCPFMIFVIDPLPTSR